jgi:hypothetical protein
LTSPHTVSHRRHVMRGWRQGLAAIALLGALMAACAAPDGPPASLDPVTDLACRLMPTVRQVRQDVHDAVAAAVRGDATATTKASERAGSDGTAIADAIARTGLHGESLGERLIQILSVGLWGQQVWSFFTMGVPDRAAIAAFAETTHSLDSIVETIVADMEAAGLGGC